ncbi:ribose 5-phosphate isomerase A [Deinococcus sp. HMF7620]|uniref:Ribose-5-phosphate isomerase A n=1 Tax=Deinococcus arboris TaxID=2682977 RepID=A0A7C9M8U6_9DEIO|nr:ribose 5-phosphate isomerase A [Deinococcus arboris]MVN87199.1 ribose 5-phosphate isomerase A [Deinococcus arboris]
MSDLEALKKEAALRAVALVESGMRVGLGTGSTAKYAIEELGRKLSSGELSGIVGVATSEASDALARQVGIPVEPLDPRPLDIAIDGADEIAPNLDLIKGLGGALLREKLTEVQARRFVVIADHTKLVERIGEKSALPIEIARFGFLSTIERLREVLPAGRLRQNGAQPYVTDNGNYIFDAQIPAGQDSDALERTLKGTLGVVDTGLFLGMAERAFVAAPDGVTELTPQGR